MLSLTPAPCVLALLMCCTPVVAGLIPTTVLDPAFREPANSDELEQAVAAFERGDVGECERILAKNAEAFGDLPPAPVMVARLYLAVGDLSEAQRRLDESAITFPTNPEVYASLGELALAAGRVTDAWLQYEKAGAMPAPSAWSTSREVAFRKEVTLKRAEVAERRRDWPLALSLYRERRDADQASLPAQLGIARTLVVLDRVDEAEREFVRARELDGQLPDFRLLVALIYERQAKDDLAEEWFVRAVSGDGVPDESRLQYAQRLLAKGDIEAAREELSKTANDPSSSRLHSFLLGLIARAAGDLDSAEATFAALHQADVRDWESANHLALALIESKDEVKRSRALALAESNARQVPNHATPLATLGWINLRLGSLDRAEELITRAAQLAPADPQTGYYLADLLRLRGRENEAAAVLAKVRDMRGYLRQRASLNPTGVESP